MVEWRWKTPTVQFCFIYRDEKQLDIKYKPNKCLTTLWTRLLKSSSNVGACSEKSTSYEKPKAQLVKCLSLTIVWWSLSPLLVCVTSRRPNLYLEAYSCGNIKYKGRVMGNSEVFYILLNIMQKGYGLGKGHNVLRTSNPVRI